MDKGFHWKKIKVVWVSSGPENTNLLSNQIGRGSLWMTLIMTESKWFMQLISSKIIRMKWIPQFSGLQFGENLKETWLLLVFNGAQFLSFTFFCSTFSPPPYHLMSLHPLFLICHLHSKIICIHNSNAPQISNSSINIFIFLS